MLMSEQTNDNLLSAIMSNNQGEDFQNNFASDIKGEIPDDNQRNGGYVHDFVEVPSMSGGHHKDI